jgi:hypothetical protein
MKKDSMIRLASEGKWDELFLKFDEGDIEPPDTRVLINMKSPKYFGTVLWHAVQHAVTTSTTDVLNRCLRLGADPSKNPDAFLFAVNDGASALHVVDLLIAHGARYPDDVWRTTVAQAEPWSLPWLRLVYAGEPQAGLVSTPEVHYFNRVWSPARRLVVAALSVVRGGVTQGPE